MDLIASTQAGLVEHLEDEAAALAGRPRDLVQRGIAYHHLYDCSGGAHAYALLAAEGAVGLTAAIERMTAAARRARWRIGRDVSDALVERVARFGEALAAIDRERCEAMVVAYRLLHRPGLRAAAFERLDPALIAAFDGDEGLGLFLAHQQWVEDRWGVDIEAAIAELGWPLRSARARAAIAALRIPLSRYQRAARRGWPHVERKVLQHPALPKGAARNPAHHYYAMQRSVTERRRQTLAALGLPPEETVVLAAA